MRGVLFVLALVTTLADTHPASGQPPAPEDTPQPTPHVTGERDGWLLGMDAFAGNGLESNASVAAGMGVQIGWMLRPTLALLLDTHGAAVGTSDVSDFDVSASVGVRTIAAASMQWWPSRRFWLRGGVGPAWLDAGTASVGVLPSTEISATKSGFGAAVTTGYELYRGSLFALDVHLRYAGVRADGEGYSSVVAGLGFGWYPSNSTPLEQAGTSSSEPSEPKAPQWRDKWILGLAAVGGLPLSKGDDERYWNAGAGAAFQVGWMLNPKFALMLDTHGMAVGRSEIQGYSEDENNALVQGVVVVAAQYWTTKRFWLKAGLGGGEVRASATVTGDGGQSFDITETETGFGTLAAVGYEFYQGASIGIDVHARYAGIFGNELNGGNLVLGVGLGWYP